MAHHGEGAASARAMAEAQVFIVQLQPQLLQQAGKLFGSDPRLRLAQQLGTDPQALQQGAIVMASAARATQGSAGKVTGDGAFAHEGRSVH